MIDLRSVSEESLLKEIDCRVELLLQALRNYLAYKIFSAEDSVTCGELATETSAIHKLLKALSEYTEREKMKQGLFKMLHEETARFNKENDDDTGE